MTSGDKLDKLMIKIAITTRTLELPPFLDISDYPRVPRFVEILPKLENLTVSRKYIE